MKVSVYADSGMQTVAVAADGDAFGDVIEVSDKEWARFQAISEQYEGFLSRFRRTAEDTRRAELEELERLRARTAVLESRLGAAPKKQPAPPKPPRAPSPLDETDAGNGIREFEANVSASDFKHELQALRAQNVARRRRRAIEH